MRIGKGDEWKMAFQTWHIFLHHWQYGYTICVYETYLDAYNQLGQTFQYKQFITIAQKIMIKSLSSSVLVVRNVFVKIFAKYLVYTDILALIIILLIWPFKLPINGLDNNYPQRQ